MVDDGGSIGMKNATAEGRMRELQDEHQALEARLRILTRRAYLTPDEQRECTEIKRQKLSAKDRLEALSRMAKA
jgi:hypothetical protein